MRIVEYGVWREKRKGMRNTACDTAYPISKVRTGTRQATRLSGAALSTVRPSSPKSSRLKGASKSHRSDVAHHREPVERHHGRQSNDPKPNGFTLIEIVMTIVLVSILAALAAVIILQGVRAYSDEDSRSDIHYQTRLAVERISREARQIRSCNDIIAPANPSNTLSFFDVASGGAVTFTINAVTQTLSRGTDILATGITSTRPFQFLKRDGLTPTASCIDPDDIWFINISVTDAKGKQSLPMRTMVHPRNF
jgi:prepilin-type N-terminal cleavage/methylation domain-containing protein